MRRLRTALLLACAVPPLLAAPPEKGSAAERESQNWSFTPAPGLPNVLILGDSISIGYTREVRRLLAGKANIFRPLAANGKGPENCAGTTKGVAEIDRWLAGHRWDVIHFNFGLHDLKHVAQPGADQASNNPGDPPQATVAQYAKNLEALVAKLKATGARLIFATTTPVAPDTRSPPREPDAPPRYNQAALTVMQENNVGIDDLFAFCAPQLKQIQLPRNVHFTPEGYRIIAGQVEQSIRVQLALGAAAPAGP